MDSKRVMAPLFGKTRRYRTTPSPRGTVKRSVQLLIMEVTLITEMMSRVTGAEDTNPATPAPIWMAWMSN